MCVVHADTYKAIREKSGTDQKYTVLVYMCGTNFEDDGAGNATKDIMHMLKSNYDLTNTNVLILAGGTKDWNSKTMKNAKGLEDSPLKSLMETASGVAVRAMRSDNMLTLDEETDQFKEESEKVDIVISTSDYMTPGIFLSGNAEIGDSHSDSDKLVIDTSLINLLACYVTGTSEIAE